MLALETIELTKDYRLGFWRNRIKRALPARLNHRGNDLRMLLDIAFGEGCFGKGAASFFGRHRLRRIRRSESVASNPDCFGTTGGSASQDE